MTAQFEGFYEGLNSDDEDEVADEYSHSKEATIFLIEATHTMLDPSLLDPSHPVPAASTQGGPSSTQAIQQLGGWKEAPKSKMEVCLRTAYAMMKRKVISAPKDSLAIIIFNTAKKGKKSNTGGTDKDHFNYLLELAQPDAQNIRRLKDLLEKAQKDPQLLPTIFAPNEGQNVVADAFGMCNTIFRTRAPNKSYKNVFFVTDNDDPVEGNHQLTEVAMIKRRDLHHMGFHLEAFLIPARPEDDFRLERFYERVLANESLEEAAVLPKIDRNIAVTLDNMISSMRNKEVIKRTAFSVPFVLGDGFVIGVSAFQLIGEEKKKASVKVDLNTETGDEVISKTIYKDEETGGSLDPKKDIRKYFQVGKSDLDKGVEATKIFFDEADLRKIKTLGRAPGLKLLGFKPREMGLKFHETVKHSYFLQPNEEAYSGSTRTFASLVKSMVKKNVVGFGVLIARTTSRPQMVVMIPQVEKLNAYGILEVPGGMHICQLPFADDIRHHGIEGNATVTERVDAEGEPDMSSVDTAKQVIKHVTKAYNPDDYPNPALNYFYECLAAMALDEDFPNPEDQTLPKYHKIENRAGRFLKQLKEQIPEDLIDHIKVEKSKKRRELPVDENAVMNFASDFFERGSSLKVDELKAGLRALGEKATGKKEELLARVKEALEKRGMAEEVKADNDEEQPETKKIKRSQPSKVDSSEADALPVEEPNTEQEDD